jgi:tripartite-type tricarboxylate transporter receptor subunit TctC
MLRWTCGVLSLAICCLSSIAVSAQGTAFYQSKTITLILGFNPGGAFDAYGRTVARHWGTHIRGKPSFVVKNMPGAGSLKSAQHLYAVAQKDGTVLGLINSSLASTLLLKTGRVEVDLRRFNWIGSPARLRMVAVVWSAAPVKRLEDLKTKELIVGAAGSTTVMLQRAAQKILDLKLKVITGYQGTEDTFLAMERGEVQGTTLSYAGVNSSQKHWFQQKKAKILFQYGLTRGRELPNVPTLIQLAETEKQRAALRFLLIYQDLGRPFVTPPGVPGERVLQLRESFNAMVKDTAFLQEAKKRRLDVVDDFPKGEDLQNSVDELYRTPSNVIEYIRQLGSGPINRIPIAVVS